MDQILTYKLFWEGGKMFLIDGLFFFPQTSPKKVTVLLLLLRTSEMTYKIGKQFLKVVFWITVNGILSTTVLFVTMRED